MTRAKLLSLAVAAVATAGVVAVWQMREAPQPVTATASATAIALTPAQEEGRRAYELRCAKCHGIGGAGTDKGPTFLHKVYEPSHHPDQAFELAARLGARAHHWKFGDMPPVTGITDAEIPLIIDYVRAIQRANGIK